MISRQVYRDYCKHENKVFVEKMGNRLRVEYIREPDYLVKAPYLTLGGMKYVKGKLLGTMVAVRGEDGIIKFGFSFKHPTLEKVFDKAIGLRKAIERAEQDDFGYNIPSRYDDVIDDFIERAHARLNKKEASDV